MTTAHRQASQCNFIQVVKDAVWGCSEWTKIRFSEKFIWKVFYFKDSRGFWVFHAFSLEKNEGVFASTVAPCNMSSFYWYRIYQTLTTCEVTLADVKDEDFSIDPTSYTATPAFTVSSKNIKFLPKNLHQVFPNLVAFSFSSCSIEFVSGNHFQNLTKLKDLSLIDNKFKEIAADAFADLIDLQFLYLNQNRINFLWQTTFDSLKKLNVLSLTSNQKQHLHPTLFDSLVPTSISLLEWKRYRKPGQSNFYKNAEHHCQKTV